MSGTPNYWQRISRQRQSRRRVLGGAATAALGAVTATIVGCGDDDDDTDSPTASPTGASGSPTSSTSPTAAGEPQSGGELTFSQTPSTQTLDPHTSLTRAWMYTGFFADKLVSSHHQDLEPMQGEIVESWEQVDNVTLRLKVRPGVHFHEGKITNGRALVAEDVAFNLLRIAGKLDSERAALFARSTTLADMADAVAVDDETVEVSFDRPNSQFINGMGDWRNWVVARENVEADPNFTDFGAQAGTGPFIIDEWESASEVGRYIRNPNYWKEPAFLESVRQVSLPDTAATQSAFVSGNLGFFRAQAPEVRDRLGSDGFELDDWEHVGWEYFRLNHTREPFTNPQIRRAVALAIDPSETMNFNYGEGFWDFSGPLISGFPGVWSSDEVRQQKGWNPDTVEEDRAEARAIMEAAGFPDGEISFGLRPQAGTGPWNANGHLIKDQLEQVWPDIDITIVGDQDTAGWPRALATGDWDAVTYASFPPPSAIVDAGLHYRTGGGRNYTQYSNSEVDALLETAFSAIEEEPRLQAVGELQQLLVDEMVIFTLGKSREVQLRQPWVRGFMEGWQPGPGTFAAYDPVFSARHLWIDESRR